VNKVFVVKKVNEENLAHRVPKDPLDQKENRAVKVWLGQLAPKVNVAQ
jgi:hypothetical protein